MRRRARRWLLALLTVALVASGVALLLRGADGLRTIELATYDLRMDIRGKRAAPRDIVVVAIDDQTFADLGERWPFRRSVYAKLVDRLHASGARLIALDLQFTEPGNPGDDLALYNAIDRARPVILATTVATKDGHSTVFGGDANVKAVGARVGMSIFPVDRGGVVRRVPRSLRSIRSFAFASADVLRGRRIGESGVGPRGAWIDFRGPPQTFRTVSFSRVLRDRAVANSLRNAVVVVGATAPSLHDVHSTAASGDRLMSGAELQANAIATARDGFPLRSAGSSVDVLLIVLLAGCAPLVAAFARQRWAFAAGLAALAALAIGTQLAFGAGKVTEVTYPALAGILALAGTALVAYLDEHIERNRLRRMFANFERDVVDAVLDPGAEGGGRRGVLDRESIIGGYRIEQLVGEGGMGAVYEATQAALRRRVALKVIRPVVADNPLVKARFKRESLLAAAVEHPNVIPVYDAGENEGILYIAMRFIAGEDLAALLVREGPLDPWRGAHIVGQVAEALEAAHRSGLVHRDVKPGNVLIVSDDVSEHVYLTDFGVTKEIDQHDRLTEPGHAVGTIDYMAPEQIRALEVSPAADIYSLGCVLYEVLAGHVPFPDESPLDVMLKHVNARPPRLADSRLAVFDEVIEKAMAKSPDERFASARAFAIAVRAAAETVGPEWRPAHERSAHEPSPPVTSAPTRPS